MKKATSPQISCIGAITSKLNIGKDAKATMVQGFSSGRCTSSKDLFYNEAVEMIRHLKSVDPDEKACEPMRKKILHYAHLLTWTKKNYKNEIVADVERVDKWMLQFSYLHKKLYSYQYAELPKLVTQFQKFYTDVTSKI